MDYEKSKVFLAFDPLIQAVHVIKIASFFSGASQVGMRVLCGQSQAHGHTLFQLFTGCRPPHTGSLYSIPLFTALCKARECIII